MNLRSKTKAQLFLSDTDWYPQACMCSLLTFVLENISNFK